MTHPSRVLLRAAACCLLCAAGARAQSTSTVQGLPPAVVSRDTSPVSAESDGRVFFEPKEKVVVGTQRYFSNDFSLLVDLPAGFNANAGYYAYRSDISSRTTTFSLGAGKDWDEGFLDVTYSWTPLVNNYRSHSWEVRGAYLTPSKDFRTTIGGTFDVTYHTQFVPDPKPKNPMIPVGIRQTTAALNLRQRIHDTKLSLDFGKSSYDREVSRLAARINPNSTRLQGLAGLLAGFPDLEWKLGISQDLGKLFTAWTSYDHVRLLVAQSSGHADSDSYALGLDAYAYSWLSGTLQYSYLTETGQPKSSQWGLTLRARL